MPHQEAHMDRSQTAPQLRDVERGAPGDHAIFSANKTPEQKQMAKRRSQYFGDAFAYRESNTSPRERVSRESVVMVEVRTNVIVHDEYTFITDLSYAISNRYQRPESSVLVTINHSACLLFGGSFEPAYIMSITALPSQVQPVTNKRNASLIQKSMEEALGVPPARGLVKFIAIDEANLANNGKTVLGEIEDLEKEQTGENIVSRTQSSNKKRHSVKSVPNMRNGSSLSPISSKYAAIDEQYSPPLPPVPDKDANDLRADKVQKMGRRKSFIAAVFGK